MKRFTLWLCALTVGAAVFSSCLKDDNDETTVYADTAIIEFTLGSLNRYTQTTSSKTGNDTVVKTTVTGTSYKMTIDQTNCRIYNQKELPVGTDVGHVVCTVKALNNGIITVQSMISDSLRFYSSTDSIDFSQPRVFRIYSSDANNYRDYTVTLNVSSTKGLTFGWELAQTLKPEEMADHRLEATADTVGMVAQPELFAHSGMTYTLSRTDSLLKSSPDGNSWQTEALDDDPSLLPAPGTETFVDWDYAMANNTKYVLLVGAPRQDDEANMRVWRKLAPQGGGGQWVYMPFDDSNRYPLPRQQRALLAYHEGAVLCLTDDGTMLKSRDQGISWRKSTDYKLPNGLEGTPIALVSDTAGRLWLLTDTGQLWRGATSK